MTNTAKEGSDVISEVLRYSVSLVTQNKFRFYTLTMPSDVLARTSFVSTRDEDPISGFQRLLDEKRATEIANYVDSGFGTIPSSIVLSAQANAELEIVGRGKTLQFRAHPKSFMILDGQHRVYGFSKAKTHLRVSVVIYSGLSRNDEVRLFIDINSKQRPVPSELLLDIKLLAQMESDGEAFLRTVFDLFHSKSESAMLGLTSPAEASSSKISRVTFNNALKPHIELFSEATPEFIFSIINSYIGAFMSHLGGKGRLYIVKPTLFKSMMSIFPDVASKVKDRYGTDYTLDNFYEVMRPIFMKIPAAKFANPGTSYKELAEEFRRALRSNFSLI